MEVWAGVSETGTQDQLCHQRADVQRPTSAVKHSQHAHAPEAATCWLEDRRAAGWQEQCGLSLPCGPELKGGHCVHSVLPASGL